MNPPAIEPVSLGVAEGPAFPVVGLGASAGGLEALRQLFAGFPTNPDIGVVLIQHLDPERPSMLTSVLESVTSLRVVEAASDMPVEANRVHVIPSGSDLCIKDGVLTLIPRQRTGGLHLPIDAFFRSLAEDLRERAIGVVLSGSGADGTEGLRAIKAEGGIAIAQEPESAQFRGMPDAALRAGVVDFCGTPDQIASELTRLSRHPYIADSIRPERAVAEPGADGEKEVSEVLSLLRQHAGTDFSGYKRTTVRRRIERRMALRHATGVRAYADALRGDPGEAHALAQDMLVHVTQFFRDPDAFAALRERVFCELLSHKEANSSIRVWVPGCATGEEAYSVAICLLESLEDRADQFSIKLFGTDLSDAAIDTARAGCYPDGSLTDVSAERLARFFEHADGGYRIGSQVRDLCVFVKHDLCRDPPFAKLDLVSCRNVLIYFEPELQRRVLPILHYCLTDPGYLFLGQSEMITGFRDMFAPVDEKHRIFIKTGESARIIHSLSVRHEAELPLADSAGGERRHPAREAQKQADHLLLGRYAPPGVIVNDRLEIVQFRGRTGAYLESAPGQPQTNLLRMARDGLVGHLHDAIARARGQGSAVRQEGIEVQEGAERRVVNLEVTPLAGLPGSVERHFLVLFEESRARPESEARVVRTEPAAGDAGRELERLKAELVATKDYLQSLLSEHEGTSDELAAANEELTAANEELQSTNEELQSAKEELQSTNEELSTLNDQLRMRNGELDRLANDLVNVLSSVEIPVIIVDLELRVRRFTPTVRQIASFIPEDVGRPIDDLRLKLRLDDLPARIQEVIDALSPRQWDVQGSDGHWFRMQIRPYHTADHRLDGAVLSFLDVDALERARRDAEAARDYAHSIVETVTTALVVLDSSFAVVSHNRAFSEMFALRAGSTPAQSWFELGAGLAELPAVRRALDDALTNGVSFTALEVAAELPRIGSRLLSLTGRTVARSREQSSVLLALDDVTDLRALESERAELLESERESRREAERANRAKDLFLATLSHELRTPVSTVLLSAQSLQAVGVNDSRIERAGAVIERSARTQAKLIEDLLDISRIISGKLRLELGPVDLAGVIQEAVDAARPSAEAKALGLTLEIDDSIGVVFGDALRLQQVATNLLANAVKFTPHEGSVRVRLERRGNRALFSVSDNGVGFSPELLPNLFDWFVQAGGTSTRTHGGLGLGLAIVRHIVEAHGGEVSAESPGEGCGATFRVALPLGREDAHAAAG